MSGYQQPPPPKHTTSSYSSGNSDPFNNPHQLNYDPNANYSTGPNPYATTPGGPNPGAGGAGVAPPGAGGQYAPYYDNQPEMENRYEGGGMGRETWASESGWSGNGMFPCISCCLLSRWPVLCFRLPRPAELYAFSILHPYLHREQGWTSRTRAICEFLLTYIACSNAHVQPAWTQEANIPLSKEEIEDVLIYLANKFGFQKGESSSKSFG